MFILCYSWFSKEFMLVSQLPFLYLNAAVDQGRCSDREIEKCSKRSYVLTNILPHIPNKNLIIKLKNLDFHNFSSTVPE